MRTSSIDLIKVLPACLVRVVRKDKTLAGSRCKKRHRTSGVAIMSTPEDIDSYVAGLKVTELREELKKLNQPHHGNKATLGQRLREALEKKREESNPEEEEEEKEQEEETEAAKEPETSAQEIDGAEEAAADPEEEEEAIEESETAAGEVTSKTEETEEQEEAVEAEDNNMETTQQQQQEAEEPINGEWVALNRVRAC